jgi:hypothetical protein
MGVDGTFDVDHILLTRFNLPSKGYESLIRARQGWLRDRVDLFEKYCLPSVQSQTRRPSGWIIYFDPESPEWLIDRMQKLNADRTFCPIFRSEVSRVEMMADIDGLIGHRKALLLTTNLDNDDGLACDFVERLQAVASVDQTTAIYLTRGLIRSSKGIYLHEDLDNAFCSVLAPWAEPETCWADWHNRLKYSMPVVRLQGSPAWLQVIHGTNVSNRVHGRRISPTVCADRFPGLISDVGIPTPAQLLIDLAILGPGRRMREACRRLAKAAIQGTSGRERIDGFKVWLASKPNSNGSFTGSAEEGLAAGQRQDHR